MSAAAPLPDAEARRRIAEDLDATLFVEAAAGTGKTTALVARIVALLRAGRARLESLAAVTFTEKAAGEMKLRLREAIEAARAASAEGSAERAHLDTALGQLELARIGTIHAFCSDLLHERPVEAGVDPLFEVFDEAGSAALLDAAFDAWFESVLADPPEGVRRVLRRRPERRFGAAAPFGPRALLRGAVGALVEHRDFEGAWRLEPFERGPAIDAVMARLVAAAALEARSDNPADDWLAKSFAAIGRFTDEVALRESVRGRDHDGLEAELRTFARERHWRWSGSPRKPYGPDLSRKDARAVRDEAKAALDALVAACDADLAPRLHAELQPVIAAYEEAKRKAGRLDFLDLLVRARDLVRDDASVRREFQARFSHFFVDEFQDTDPLQAEILLLLAADDPAERDWRRARPLPGKLFIVGDPKQSIYRFRRADVALYGQVKQQLAGAGADVLHLSASFRAVPGIQAVVNEAFAPVMSSGEPGEGGAIQADYVPLERVRAPESAARTPPVVVLPVPRPLSDYGRVVQWRIEQSFPDAVGAFVAWLVTEGGREARDVCLLLRRFQSFGEDVTRPYVRALEARRIPHVLVGGRSFHEREEVLAVRNALAAIEWPDDELRVFASLRGPFFSLGDDALLAFRTAHRRLHPLAWRDPEKRAALGDAEREVAEALRVLGALHGRRNRRPIAETLSRLLAAVRAHAGLANWPTGEQALANVLHTVDLARRFERRGAVSFRGFVEHLESEAERGQSEDAPMVEEGTEGVRIMTVHRAKGLEFPVVVLADPTCNAVGRNPTRHVDPARGLWVEPLCGSVPPDLRDAAPLERARDEAEALRLAYVAATRARDLLVVPGVRELDPNDPGHALAGGWLRVLDPLVYAARETPTDSVRWWDLERLALDVEEQVGLRQQRILEADEGEVQATGGAQAHARWQAARAQTRASAASPTLRVRSVREAAAEAAQEEGLDEVAVESVDLDPAERAARPSGERFGNLVHAVLEAVSFEADAAEIEAVSRVRGRLFGAASEEVVAATAAVRRALAHPRLRAAAAAEARGVLRREAPVLLREPDGSLIEGRLDLAYQEPGGSWCVVDYKTGLAGRGDGRDAAQVRAYVRAVRAATGEPARGVLLRI